MKLLSIIIPMYNVENYIIKCIDSIYQQNISDDNFEVILVDDESPDNSFSIAKQKIKNRSNAKIIQQKNKGLGGARNTGINNALGKFLIFLDSDDWFINGSLSKLIEYTKLDLDVIEFGCNGINDEKIIYTKSLSSQNIIPGIEYYKLYRYMDSACNKLYNLEFLNNHHLRFKEKIYIEDYEFNTRVFFFAKRVKAIELIASNFYQSQNSITRTNNVEKIDKMKNDIIYVIEIIKEFYINQNKLNTLNSIQNEYFLQRLSFLNTTIFFQLFKNNFRFKDFIELRKKLISKNIFYINYSIYETPKNLFRVILLKNFNLLRIVLKLKKII